MSSIAELLSQAEAAVTAAEDLAALDAVRVQFLGKKGVFTAQLREVGKLPPAEIPAAGKAINDAKAALTAALDARRDDARERSASPQQLARRGARRDAAGPRRTRRASCTRSRARCAAWCEILGHAGFDVHTGPEVEDDFHNFTALNIPADHPARAMHDTFYLRSGLLLRTHTSPVQIRALKAHGAPIRLIAPGRVYRRDSDLTHTPMFTQVEGLVVDRDVSFANLKALLYDFVSKFFERDVRAALPAVVLSVHGAVGRGRRALASRAAGSRSWAAEWCIRTCCATPASIRRSSAATRSAWAWSGSRCCATASTTCARSSRTTCASSSSSAELAAMRVNIDWLRDWVELEGDAERVAADLTTSGLEVESVEPLAAPRSTASSSPRCCASSGIRTPTGCPSASSTTAPSQHQVVCGAPNVAAGIKAPFARVGAQAAGRQGDRRRRAARRASRTACCARPRSSSSSTTSNGLLLLDADAPNGDSARRLSASRRRGPRDQRHAEPRRLLQRPRHRARARGAARPAAVAPRAAARSDRH